MARFWRVMGSPADGAARTVREGATHVVGGSGNRLKLEELHWYLDALAGRPLPLQQIEEYVNEGG